MATAVLSTIERRALKTHTATVHAGLGSFIEVGNALLAIRDGKLYVEDSETFEQFCKVEFGISVRQAYRFIESANVMAVVCPIGPTIPQNEATTRVLAELPTPQQQATVWAKAVETAPKDSEGKPKVTAAHVKKVADSISPNRNKGKEPKAPQPEPEAEPEENQDADAPPTIDGKIAAFNKSLESLARKIASIANEFPEGLDELSRQTVRNQLKGPAGTLRARKAHGACHICAGKGCKKCSGNGWLTKVEFDSTVPRRW
jgi:hypothetical protein